MRVILPSELEGEVIFEIVRLSSGGHRMQSTLKPVDTLQLLLQLCTKLAAEVAAERVILAPPAPAIKP